VSGWSAGAASVCANTAAGSKLALQASATRKAERIDIISSLPKDSRIHPVETADEGK
jgi:hypothetical protein